MMNSISKLAIINGNARNCEALLCASSQVYNSWRPSSDDVRLLKRTDGGSLKRGRGGRSSFSGVVATIFGASGFMGRYVCNRLGKTGTQMIIPYRGDFYQARHLKVAGDLGQVLFQPYHLCDEDSIRKAVKHSSVVINLVGRDWNTRNFTMHQTHVEGAERIARISKEMGVEKFIHMSALNSDIEHPGYLKPGGSEFLRTKGESEEAVRQHFPNAIIFRPSDCFGQQDRFLFYYMRFYRYQMWSLPVPYAGLNIWKQPVYVGDVGHGIVNAVYDDDALGNTYDATGPRRYELRELLEYFHRVTRRDECKVTDLKWSPISTLKAKLNDYNPSFPVGMFILDKIEREVVNDTPSGLPTLEDLGVPLTKIEDRIKWELKHFKANAHYTEELGEFEEPAPPKFVEVS